MQKPKNQPAQQTATERSTQRERERERREEGEYVLTLIQTVILIAISRKTDLANKKNLLRGKKITVSINFAGSSVVQLFTIA